MLLDYTLPAMAILHARRSAEYMEPTLPAQSPPSFSDTWASVSLDLVRGLAAILVLVDHWRNLFFLNNHEVRDHRLFFAVPYTLTAAAHEAVVIFFVLSGFLIGGTVRRAIERGEWSWKSYLTHRLVRLWIVLLPGLMLCLLLDKIGVAFAASRSLFPGDAAQNDTAVAFVGNLFFLQGVFVPAFGSDGPLWSLANEFWYYILFPLGMLAMLPSTRPRTRLIGAALFLVLCLWLRTTLLPLFPIWLLGAALFGLPRPPLGNLSRWLAAATYVPIVFLCTYLHRILGIGSDYILAAATATLMWTLLSASQTAPTAAVESAFLAWSRAFLLHPLRRPFPAPDAYRRPRGRRSTLATDSCTHRCRPRHSGSDSRVCLRNCSIDGVPHGSRPNVGGTALRWSDCAVCTRCQGEPMSPVPPPFTCAPKPRLGRRMSRSVRSRTPRTRETLRRGTSAIRGGATK